MQDVYDITIIGAGIAGLYAGYRLKKDSRTHQKNIAIFEASHRIGGRIETFQLNDFLPEAGAMRLEPEIQIELNQLIKELQLETSDTFENYGLAKTPKNEKLFVLTGEEKNKTPLELLYLAISKILTVDLEDLKQFNRNDFLNIYTKAKYKGKYLWEMGWWEVLSDVLSYSAIKYIMIHGHFYHFIHENLNAAAEIVFFIRILKTNYRLKNIKGGMDRLVLKLEALLEKHNLYVQKSQKLIHFEEEKNTILLKFENKKLVRTKSLILTMPLPNLKELNPCFPKHIQDCFECAEPMKLLKLFYVVKNPWWPKLCESNFQAQKIPARELHYYYSSENETGMMMLCADQPFSHYWRSLFSKENQPESRVNMDENLIMHFCKFFSCDTDKVIGYAVRDWGKSPYHGALSFWKSGYHLKKIIQQTRFFKLGNNPIYICGDTFTDYQGFIEGSIRSTNEVMEFIFKHND